MPDTYPTPPTPDLLRIVCQGHSFELPTTLLQPHPNLLECFREKHKMDPRGYAKMNTVPLANVTRLVQFFKTRDYTDPDPATSFSLQQALRLHADVFILALLYYLVHLQAKAVAKFRSLLRDFDYTIHDIIIAIDFIYDIDTDLLDTRALRNAVLEAVLPIAHDLALHDVVLFKSDKLKYFDLLQGLTVELSLRTDL